MQEKQRMWLEDWIIPGLLSIVALGGILLYLRHLKQITDLGVTFDDAWIHFNLARNLAETGAMGINPGQWSGGNSSLLWGLLLAFAYRLFGSTLVPALVLGAAAHAISAGLFYHIAQDSLGRIPGVLCGLLYALSGPLLFLSLSGMETSLFLLLALAVVWIWMGRQPALSGPFLFLLLLTRLEALVLWGLLLLHYLLWGRRTTPLRAGLSLILSGPLAFFFNGLLHLQMEGLFFPLTMTGRRWLWQVEPSRIPFWPSNWEPIGTFYEIWNVYFWDWLLQSFRLEGRPALMWLYRALWLVLLLAGAVWLGRTAWQERPRQGGVVLLVLWAAGHMAIYPFSLPVATPRHQVVVFPALFLLAGAGLEALRALLHRALSWGWPPVRRYIGLVWGPFAGLLLLWSAVIFGQWQINYVDHVRHINEIHVRLALWVDDNLSQDAVVAAYDIGAISYMGNREIVDLGGLVDPDLLPYLYDGDIVAYLYAHGVTHLAMIGGPAGEHWWKRLGLVPPALGQIFDVEELQAFEIAPYVYAPFDRPAYWYYYPASRHIAVYAVYWLTVPAEGALDIENPSAELLHLRAGSNP